MTRKEIALANLREFEVAKKRGELADRALLGRMVYEQFRRARDSVQTTPSREAATVAAELGLEPRLVLPVLESLMRRVLAAIAEPSAAQQAFLVATAPAQEAPAA